MTQFNPIIFVIDNDTLPFHTAGFFGCAADRVCTFLHNQGFVTRYEVARSQRLVKMLRKLCRLQLHY